MRAVEIVLLAMTWMRSGFCLAGMDPATGRWVRPVKPAGQWQELADRNGEPIHIGDRLRLVDPCPRPQPPHSEDVVTAGLVRVGRLPPGQLLHRLREWAEDEGALRQTLAGEGRSLCLVRVDRFWTAHQEADLHRTRLAFRIGTTVYQNRTALPGYPCTDLVWRAYKGAGGADPSPRETYLAIGLSRAFTDRRGFPVPPSPMVVAVLTVPPLATRMGPVAC